MSNRIIASDDITDYRGHTITNFGDYFEVIENHDNSLFGIYDSLAEAEKAIDEILDLGEDAEVLALEHQAKYNKSRLDSFAEWRDIDIDPYGNVLSTSMSHPTRDDKRIAITYENLSSMLKSFNKRNNTTLRVEETADGFKISWYGWA